MTRLTQHVIFLFVLFSIDSVWLQQLPPQFPPTMFAFMPENKTNGSLIKSFDVTDADNDVITLDIYDEFTRSSVYLVQSNSRRGFVTGNVYLSNPDNFDFDRGRREVNLGFTANDGQNTVTEIVHVFVSDVNDNAPEFKRPAYIYEIPENSTYPSTHDASISATDADDGVNSYFVFHLNATGQSSGLYKDVFSIDPNNGNLTLKRRLDYETLSFYQYTIEAVDTGSPSKTGSAEITIKVTDVQDTPPNFQGLPYLFTITENSLWSVSDILAQDGDRGIPRDIHYRLNDSDCSKLFLLNGTTGKISLKNALDRDTGIVAERQGVCRFQIEANEISNAGEILNSTNSTSNTTVTVTVDDVDDNFPTFNKSHYEAYVDEGVSSIPLTIVGSVGIDVFDLDQGSNSEFSLTVECTNGTKCVGIEATPSSIISRATFLLRLVNSYKFDYETEQSIGLRVVARGKVNSSMSATCTVTVNISNTNDNDPTFNRTDYTAIIPENPETGTFVTVITAEDKDLGEYGELNYTLKGSSLFDINHEHGTISTTGNPDDLDRETRDTYYLTVVATDGGDKRAVVSLTVTLSDVNDNTPKFLYDTVEMSINENTTKFTPNILIKATDGDESGTYNSDVWYRLHIPDTNLYSNFTINDTTGELIAKYPLDYENLTPPSEDGQIQLIVIAEDRGIPSLYSNITVTINVHDENDNTPKFVQNTYAASIPENSLQGKTVVNVSATDDDATSPNNIIRYYIENGGSDKFRMNAINGIITVDLNVKFDREAQDLYNLTVIAADIGTPPCTGTTILLVSITDVNDEIPVFGQINYQANVKENITVGSIIKTCNASDIDEDSNLEYIISHYSATDSSGVPVNSTLVQNMFDVHDSNGSVFVSDSLYRVTASQVVITILVNDTMCVEHCPQTSTALLTVDIEAMHGVSFPESYPTSTNIPTVTATGAVIIGDDLTTDSPTTVNPVSTSPAPTTVIPANATTRSDIECESDLISLHVPLGLLPSGQQVTWNDPSCVVANNGTHLTGSIGLGDCGTYVVFNDSHVTFENELVSHAGPRAGTLEPQSGIDFGAMPNSVIVVQCVYPRREQESLAFRPVQGQVRFFEKTLGHMLVHMRQARDVTFADTYARQDEPRTVHLNDEVFIKLTTDQGNVTTVAINVDRCLATPSPSPLDTDFQELTNNGCPAISSVRIHNSPATEVHLSFHAFQFTSHPGAPVYIHCEVYVCPLSNPHCVTGCTNVVARSRRAATGGIKTHLVSTGPFPVTDEKEQGIVGQSTALIAVTGLCACLAVAATVFGIMAWRGRRRLTAKETVQ